LDLQENGTWDRKYEFGRPVMFVAGQHLAGALENFPLWQFLNQKFYFLT
jgi:hypothetical protein